MTQTVRLIRSKGVGIFFVTQNPTDVPDAVLGQLGNRVQHALRAFTPDDAAALAKAVRTYPKTADYDLSRGAAAARHRRGDRHRAVRERARRRRWPGPGCAPPRSLMGQIDPAAQQQAVTASPLQAKYGSAVDRDSAYERLQAKLAPPPAPDIGPAISPRSTPPDQPRRSARTRAPKRPERERSSAASWPRRSSSPSPARRPARWVARSPATCLAHRESAAEPGLGRAEARSRLS